MDYTVSITDGHNDYASRIINALRDYEAVHGTNIPKKQQLTPRDIDCLGCYATTENTLLGGLLFAIQNEWVFLSSGFVWPIYRQRGIYSEILKEIECFARDANCNGIFVSTYTFEAPHIYEHFGFTKGSVLHNIPKGNTSIDYFMEM